MVFSVIIVAIFINLRKIMQSKYEIKDIIRDINKVVPEITITEIESSINGLLEYGFLANPTKPIDVDLNSKVTVMKKEPKPIEAALEKFKKKEFIARYEHDEFDEAKERQRGITISSSHF